MADRIDPTVLTGIERGYVVAPAGCGKTQSVVAIAGAGGDRPALILTHTNAGVAALQNRAARANLSTRRCHVSTLDGWARRIALMFPSRVGALPPIDDEEYYPSLRRAVTRFVSGSVLREPLRATYCRLLVDEYQDCSIDQHELVLALAQHLPVCIFGDPLQAIFDFRGSERIHWERHVQGSFQLLVELDFPWRWEHAKNGELGRWLLQVRRTLMNGEVLDLTTAPRSVSWQAPTENPARDRQNLIRAAAFEYRRDAGSVLIIGSAANPRSRHRLARDARGLSVVEPVELKDVVRAAQSLAHTNGPERLESLLHFAQSVMTGVSPPNLMRRCRVLLKGRARSMPSLEEESALQVVRDGSAKSMRSLLQVLRLSDHRRVYRATALSALVEVLQCVEQGKTAILTEAADMVRERRSALGQRLPRRAIGSTLLLKGLEADHVIVLDAHTLPPRHLYVALTRAARTLKVFASHAQIGVP